MSPIPSFFPLAFFIHTVLSDTFCVTGSSNAALFDGTYQYTGSYNSFGPTYWNNETDRSLFPRIDSNGFVQYVIADNESVNTDDYNTAWSTKIGVGPSPNTFNTEDFISNWQIWNNENNAYSIVNDTNMRMVQCDSMCIKSGAFEDEYKWIGYSISTATSVYQSTNVINSLIYRTNINEIDEKWLLEYDEDKVSLDFNNLILQSCAEMNDGTNETILVPILNDDTISVQIAGSSISIPTSAPTVEPTVEPSLFPSNVPTLEPTVGPSLFPSNGPSNIPTLNPTLKPTMTLSPTMDPTDSVSSDSDSSEDIFSSTAIDSNSDSSESETTSPPTSGSAGDLGNNDVAGDLGNGNGGDDNTNINGNDDTSGNGEGTTTTRTNTNDKNFDPNENDDNIDLFGNGINGGTNQDEFDNEVKASADNGPPVLTIAIACTVGCCFILFAIVFRKKMRDDEDDEKKAAEMQATDGIEMTGVKVENDGAMPSTTSAYQE